MIKAPGGSARGVQEKDPSDLNDLKNLKTRLYYETEEVLGLDFYPKAPAKSNATTLTPGGTPKRPEGTRGYKIDARGVRGRPRNYIELF
jgi:hypothetical protein